MKRHSFRTAAILVLFVLASPASATIIVFKDGFHVRGKVKQPRDFIIDSASGVSITVPLAGGFYYVEDGVRHIIFSPRHVLADGIIKEEPNKGMMRLTKFGAPVGDQFILPGWEFESVTEWNKSWERDIRVYVTDKGSRFNITQRLTLLTPEIACISTHRFKWYPNYFTKELSPDTIRALLAQYYKNDKNRKEEDNRLDIFRFLYQAGWLEHAAKELAEIREAFPELKSQVLEYQENLEKRQAGQFVDNLMQAQKVGQHQAVLQALARFQAAKLSRLVSPKQLLQVQELKNKHQSVMEKTGQVREALKAIAGRLTASPTPKGGQKALAEALETIAGELHPDAAPRLETFLVYAQQFERDLKDKGKTSQSAEEVASLAISGWLQGDAVAEPDAKSAEALWQARKLILDCQKAVDSASREQLIDRFSNKYKLGVDVFARMIPFLPPPEPHETTNTEVQKMTIDVEGPAVGTTYHLQLPPEYHPSRSYPVLILLHAIQEKAEDMLPRFSELAARHGYILAAPQWGKGLRFSYTYSPREHAIVTDCLRDLRRRFQVDSDRVYLFGWRAGGTMAFDVGLSHPDLFAGVVPMNGMPGAFPQRYWANGQYLPFYAIEGDMNGGGPKSHRTLFKDWIRFGYPSLYVEYKGRASEWYAAELPIMFDWMGRKVRANPKSELGSYHTGGGQGEEFRTLRSSDNSFYWLSTNAISPRFQASFDDLASKRISPATLHARISRPSDVTKKKDVIAKVENYNHINIRTTGIQQVTVWLGREMIDFANPVQVRLNGAVNNRVRPIQPSLKTLLEDFCQRGDRQRLYIAKMDFEL